MCQPFPHQSRLRKNIDPIASMALHPAWSVHRIPASGHGYSVKSTVSLHRGFAPKTSRVPAKLMFQNFGCSLSFTCQLLGFDFRVLT